MTTAHIITTATLHIAAWAIPTAVVVYVVWRCWELSRSGVEG